MDQIITNKDIADAFLDLIVNKLQKRHPNISLGRQIRDVELRTGIIVHRKLVYEKHITIEIGLHTGDDELWIGMSYGKSQFFHESIYIAEYHNPKFVNELIDEIMPIAINRAEFIGGNNETCTHDPPGNSSSGR